MSDSNPHFHYCDDDGNVILDERFSVSSIVDGKVYTVTIWPNFESDGASVPRLFWRLVGHPLQWPLIRWALAHDWLYKSHATTKSEADAFMREGLLSDNYGIVRPWMIWFGLAMFGWFAWWSHGDDDQMDAINEGEVTINGMEVYQ